MIIRMLFISLCVLSSASAHAESRMHLWDDKNPVHNRIKGRIDSLEIRKTVREKQFNGRFVDEVYVLERRIMTFTPPDNPNLFCMYTLGSNTSTANIKCYLKIIKDGK